MLVGVEVLRQVQESVLGWVREKGVPTEAEAAAWPRKIFEGIKAGEARRAGVGM